MYVAGEQRCKLSCRQTKYHQVLRLQVDGNQHQCGEGIWTNISVGRKLDRRRRGELDWRWRGEGIWTNICVGRGTGPTSAWGGELDRCWCGEGNWTDVGVGRGTGPMSVWGGEARLLNFPPSCWSLSCLLTSWGVSTVQYFQLIGGELVFYCVLLIRMWGVSI